MTKNEINSLRIQSTSFHQAQKLLQNSLEYYTSDALKKIAQSFSQRDELFHLWVNLGQKKEVRHVFVKNQKPWWSGFKQTINKDILKKRGIITWNPFKISIPGHFTIKYNLKKTPNQRQFQYSTILTSKQLLPIYLRLFMFIFVANIYELLLSLGTHADCCPWNLWGSRSPLRHQNATDAQVSYIKCSSTMNTVGPSHPWVLHLQIWRSNFIYFIFFIPII